MQGYWRLLDEQIHIEAATQASGINYQLAEADQAEKIAKIFQLTYGKSSHSCANPNFVEKSIKYSDDVWLIARFNNEIIAILSIIQTSWLGIYEFGRAITTESWRNKGLIIDLYRYASSLISLNDRCAMITGGFRSSASYQVARNSHGINLYDVGHDGAENFANGIFEYHLLALNFKPHRIIRRVEVKQSLLTAAIFDSYLRSKFLIDNIVAEDLPYFSVQPQINLFWKEEFISEHDHSVILPQIISSSPQEAAEIVVDQLETFKDRDYISIYVPASKIGFIKLLNTIGFYPTAYLPAWYEHRGAHYDCIFLVKRPKNIKLASYGLDNYIKFWNSVLNNLLID